MNARDFIGLPVICRIPGPRYGERIGTVSNASYTAEGLHVEMRVSFGEIPRATDAFSIGPFEPLRANMGYVEEVSQVG